MCADHYIDLTFSGKFDHGFLFLCRPETGEQLNLYGKSGKSFRERLKMLIGENCRWRQNGNLPSVHYSFECGTHGDLGFAVADIADY